jgi:nucleotide-binding universal stress UspA family protein
MAIKNILIHLDNSSACEHRIEVAIQLAVQHDAQLSGIYVIPDFPTATYYEAQISADIIAEIDKEALETAKLAQSKYVEIASKAGVSLAAVIERGNPISILDEYARFTDLFVLGQNHPEDPENINEALADTLVLEVGTPCLIVPFASPKQFATKRVLVAWNASREAARTLKDAIPILKNADYVEVLLVNPSQHEADKDSIQGQRVSSFLTQHGIKSEIKVQAGSKSKPGDAIIARASEIDADVIVMGAYGHSRLREIILGGVTRKLLKQMTVPVFISH